MNTAAPRLDSKLPDVGTTIFTVMSQMAHDHGAINLSQGYPDYDGPVALRERLGWYTLNGYNQYAPLAGIPPLRAQIAAKLQRFYDHRIDPDTQVTVTPGATEAIFCAVHAVVRPGDEVIMFDPVYDSYDPAVRLAGGVPVHLVLAAPDYRIDWDAVRRAITPRTRMILVNSPHNPSGSVFEESDLDALLELAEAHDLIVMSDEVYEHLVFDGRPHWSVLCKPRLAARSYAIFSFGKTYSVTGWKIGYCIAPPLLMTEFKRVHQFVAFVTAMPLQHALADFMAHHPEHLDELPAFYQRKRDLFNAAMAGSRFRLTPSAGTFFQLAEYSAISERSDIEMVTWLTQEVGVAAIPMSVFYQSPPAQRYVRFCFCKEDDTLRAAAAKLCAL
ncbi:MAG: aminotransferase class I/II-fold pyridoxal phosphate-dependent enzyme [Gammaproteobacteria bacterium]|nr:aminotransferase class I/II-fold pyridoxal phosphate-dependent enzyme [Gammaproteobacteria bacterium]